MSWDKNKKMVILTSENRFIKYVNIYNILTYSGEYGIFYYLATVVFSVSGEHDSHFIYLKAKNCCVLDST